MAHLRQKNVTNKNNESYCMLIDIRAKAEVLECALHITLWKDETEWVRLLKLFNENSFNNLTC